MNTEIAFTSEEWNILLQAPAFTVIYILQANHSSPSVAYHKLVAGISAILDTAEPRYGSELVAAVRYAIHSGQRPYYPVGFPSDMGEARELALKHCQEAATLLAQRTTSAEADAYIQWLLSIGQIVAAVPESSPMNGQGAAEAARRSRQALATLEATLNAC